MTVFKNEIPTIMAEKKRRGRTARAALLVFFIAAVFGFSANSFGALESSDFNGEIDSGLREENELHTNVLKNLTPNESADKALDVYTVRIEPESQDLMAQSEVSDMAKKLPKAEVLREPKVRKNEMTVTLRKIHTQKTTASIATKKKEANARALRIVQTKKAIAEKTSISRDAHDLKKSQLALRISKVQNKSIVRGEKIGNRREQTPKNLTKRTIAAAKNSSHILQHKKQKPNLESTASNQSEK